MYKIDLKGDSLTNLIMLHETAQLILYLSMVRYRYNLLNLPNFKYKKHTICYDFIHKFIVSKKSENDEYNLQRELVIASIINGDVPECYFKKSPRWALMRDNVNKYIQTVIKNSFPNQEINIESIECEHKAGRKNNNDLEVTVNGVHKFPLEFKFNTTSVQGCPQFVSPCKPSVFLEENFEEWFYDNYLQKIADFGGLSMPDRKIYCSTINNNKVECMKTFKEKYKSSPEFHAMCKRTDKEAIKFFIKNSNLKVNALSDYLQTSQKNKHYMCYCNGKIFYDKLDESLYKLNVECPVKKEPTNYIVTCENGARLEVKLRFKNGCGLQFPAFQIKRKIPTVKQLKNICKSNNIILPSNAKKNDIIEALDKANVIY